MNSPLFMLGNFLPLLKNRVYKSGQQIRFLSFKSMLAKAELKEKDSPRQKF